MDAFSSACDNVNKPLVDINDQWKPFVPVWYMNKYFPTTSATVPSATEATVTAIVNSVDHQTLSAGAIAGIGVGVGGLFLGLLIAGTVYFLRSQKKIDGKKKENAKLADQLQPGGVQSYLNDLHHANPMSSQESLGITAVNTYAPKSKEGSTFRTEHYQPKPAAMGVSYGNESSSSDMLYEKHGYGPLARSPPPPMRSPPPRPHRPDEDEMIPLPRSSVPYEIQGSLVYNERGIKAHSWMSPIPTASHASPVYDVDGGIIGYRQSGS
jgi:hypothetical protein